MGSTPTILAAYIFNQIEWHLELHSNGTKVPCEHFFHLFFFFFDDVRNKKGPKAGGRSVQPMPKIKIQIRTVLQQSKLQQAGGDYRQIDRNPYLFIDQESYVN